MSTARMSSADNEIVPAATVTAMPILTSSDVLARARAIHDCMAKAMIKDVDYGVIPGCGSKPALLKPGAEKLMMLFQVAPRVTVTDLSVADPETYRYRVQVSLYSQTGVYLGDGIGEASTREKKWQRGNPADTSNTVLKMAKKRAVVDAVLTVLGASDIFTQDIEEQVQEEAPKAVPTSAAEDAVDARHLAWIEKNAPLLWTKEQITSWLAKHNAENVAALSQKDAHELIVTLRAEWNARMEPTEKQDTL